MAGIADNIRNINEPTLQQGRIHNHLHGALLPCTNGRSEHLVSGLDRAQGSLEARSIKFAMDSHQPGRILTDDVRIELINQPQTFLRARQGSMARR